MPLILTSTEPIPSTLPSWVKVKNFSPSSEFLVTSTVRDPYYRKAVSLGISILRPSFLESLQHLSNENEARDEAKDHILPRFAGLTVYFNGNFDSRLPIIIGEYGGAIVQSSSTATHIVTSPDSEPISSSNQRQMVVTAGWIRESMDLGWMANEANFEVRSKANRLRRRSARILPRKSSKKNDLPPLDIAGAQKYKRYQLCRELYVSEINCLKAIDFLIRISFEENFLSSGQIDVIFGSFHDQKKVHSELVAKLGKVLDGWNDYSQIGSIFVELASQLEEVYAPYFQGLTAALELFKECKRKNAKFRNYVKEKEKDRSIDKQKVEYLLNAPMQQLTSRIGVTLKEILGKTDASLADHVFIRAAIDVVDNVLRTCNNFKKESSESELIYRQVKNIPIQLLSRLGEPPLVELTLRRPQGDSDWQLELHQEIDETMKFLNQVVEQVEKVSSRTILIRTIPSSFCPKTPDPKTTPSSFVRSLSSSSAVKSIRSYSQRLRLRRNVSADVAISNPIATPPTQAVTPRKPPPPVIMRSTPSHESNKPQMYRHSCIDTSRETYNERSVDIPPPRPQTPPRVGLPKNWNSTPAIQEVESEEELVNPYENVKFFSPLKNLHNLRYPSIMDECC